MTSYTTVRFVVLTVLSLITKVQLEVNVSLVLLVPVSGSRSYGTELFSVAEMAVSDINADGSLTGLRTNDIVFDLSIEDTSCDTGVGLFAFVNNILDSRSTLGAFIGPACDQVCTSAAFFAGRWNVPLISFACAYEILMDVSLYPTFGRSTVSYHNIIYSIKDILTHYGWDRVLLVEGHEDIWREVAEYFVISLENDDILSQIWTLESDQHLIEEHMITQIPLFRVMVICAYGVDIIHLLCAADAVGALTGEYVFITIDYSRAVILDFAGCDVGRVHEGILDITPNVFPTKDDAFLDRLDELNVTTTIHAGLLYDAFRLYAEALNLAYLSGMDFTSVGNISQNMHNLTFQGAGGQVYITENGTRDSGFVINNIQHGTYVPIAISSGTKMSGTTTFFNTAVIWSNGVTDIPTGKPRCGWNGELCPPAEDKQVQTAITATAVVVFCLIVGVIILLMYYRRKMKLQSQLHSMSWKIASADLRFTQHRSKLGSRMTAKSFMDSSRRSSGASLMSGTQQQQIFVTVANHHGITVAIKYINKSYITVTDNIMKEINQMRSLKNANVNPLIGVSVEPEKIFLVTEYCSKGSLQDVLQNDNINLDRIFKISFASDIAKGMIYIHHSAIQCHGRLKSTNILVDSHWVCKLSDMAMPAFREGEREDDLGKHAHYRKMLWTAPEILRSPGEFPRGSQKGDVYSYGIILQEILTKSEPYSCSLEEPNQIITRVKEVEHPPYRPKVSQDSADESILDLMRICWEEIPAFRPSFVTIASTLKKSNKGLNTNLVDQMVHMMEKYADHLEEVVEERTLQLEEEQRKTEELLCRMLPRSISNDLKIGKMVEPETYEEVTVFFSDIVGFTALSSDSTPIEVVNFLNDLYICFDKIIEHYDVYKVETIGDAYMVVSGLPRRNGDQHAGEIASLALELLNAVTTFTIRHRPDKQLQLRIGIHSGPVAAGVVGLKMPRYCLFGDTVNYASRMESTGIALKIHVSPETSTLLRYLGGFHLKLRGPVPMKGKGIVETFFLEGKDGFNKPLPEVEMPEPTENLPPKPSANSENVIPENSENVISENSENVIIENSENVIPVNSENVIPVV
ncbi:atrial natriuretic peptide receptor 1-like [Pecten maximus]|uniref:atrial natriuretic peptide receptor 1-like n=1 Tax=Pecten maximus TaxID=6579 RepID=UPI0014582DB7|nr:atrial natriuretic peptide receptor 1-like [Pecten maximus]